MSARILTPAAARALLDDGNDDVSFEAASRRMRLRALAAPDLVATVEHFAAESARIYHAANAALADYLAADDALLNAIGRGQVRDEYHPLILTRDARLEYLRGVLAPKVTP